MVFGDWFSGEKKHTQKNLLPTRKSVSVGGAAGLEMETEINKLRVVFSVSLMTAAVHCFGAPGDTTKYLKL